LIENGKEVAAASVPPPIVNSEKSGVAPAVDPVRNIIPLYTDPAEDPDNASTAPAVDALTGK